VRFAVDAAAEVFGRDRLARFRGRDGGQDHDGGAECGREQKAKASAHPHQEQRCRRASILPGARVASTGLSAARRYTRSDLPMRTLDPQSLSQHVDRLYRAAWGLCGSREDAEDLVQETFARVLSRPRLIHGDDDLYYLMRVLRNTFLTSRRDTGGPRAG